MKIKNIYSLLEIGKRKNLEDYIFPHLNKATVKDRIFIVCDGVGGENKGEVASKITADTIGEYLNGLIEITEQHFEIAFNKVRQNFHTYIEQHPVAAKMTTTLTLAVIKDKSILVAWCGDSRVYHIRNNEIIWKSKDHSLIQHLIDINEISVEEAKSHPNRNIILRSISAETTFDKIDMYEINNIQNGDYILLATDGFFEQISDDLLVNSLEYSNLISNKLYLDTCKENTNDNFSMYLINLSIENDDF